MLRIRQVVDQTGLSRTSIWRLEAAGRFPCRRRLGDDAVGWVEEEIEAWLKDRPKVGTDDRDETRATARLASVGG
ncbi:MAG: helix-turn-helix transcriptional regulator [Gemmatimonadota bacterium]